MINLIKLVENLYSKTLELNKITLRTIIYYNWQRDLSQQQCFGEMKTLLNDNSVSFSTATKWFYEFNRGRDSLEDKTRYGRPNEVTDEKNVQRV